MEVPAILRTMRRRAGLSQEQMGELMHSSKSTISRMESGKTKLEFYDVLKWCKVTDNPDVWTALYAAVDIAVHIQPLSQLITGTILGWCF